MEKAQEMLRELESQRLSVVLVPAPDPHFSGHKVRAVNCENPKWYRWIHHSRKFGVKRARIEKALKRVIAGRVRANGYELDLLSTNGGGGDGR